MEAEKDQNQEKNKLHYEKLYSNYSIDNILYWINNLEEFLEASITTEGSWFAIYQEDFRSKIKGKKVVEMGCGNCINAAIMAALGAEVYANDIADASGEIVEKINGKFKFEYPIKFIGGDFLENSLPSENFDFVIGKAFLHHLTIAEEKLFIKETSRLLKPGGEARFFEPAVNNLLLDEIRWHIPIKGRPSKFNKKAFQQWKEVDPHPIRSYSSRHFSNAGLDFFEEVKIIPIGTLERFSKLLPWGEKRNRFKRWALKNEKHLADNINKSLTRSQLIIYRQPLKNSQY